MNAKFVVDETGQHPMFINKELKQPIRTFGKYNPPIFRQRYTPTPFNPNKPQPKIEDGYAIRTYGVPISQINKDIRGNIQNGIIENNNLNPIRSRISQIGGTLMEQNIGLDNPF
jgi:hypothetical protein